MKRLLMMNSRTVWMIALFMGVLMLNACGKEAKKEEGVPAGPIVIHTGALNLTYNQEARLLASVANEDETMVFWNVE